MSEKRSLPARIFVLGRDFLGFARWRAATALLLVVSGTFLEGFGLEDDEEAIGYISMSPMLRDGWLGIKTRVLE